VQLEVMLTEFAAVVARRDLDDTGKARGVDTDAKGILVQQKISAGDGHASPRRIFSIFASLSVTIGNIRACQEITE